MKKWFIVALSLFVLFIVSTYFFVPGKIVVKKSITANANQSAVYRFLTDLSNWPMWWPGSSSTKKSAEPVFESGGYSFKELGPGYNSFQIIIEKDGTADSSLLNIFSMGTDSIRIEWDATINTGSNPFDKIGYYFKAKELSKNLEAILNAMQKYISNVKNLYGIEIKMEKVKTEFLVSTRKSFSHYPGTSDIYEIINKIRKHIGQGQAKEEDYPMLYIKTYDSTHYEAQVAIPVNKNLSETDIFSIKLMLKNGNILVTEITGGKNRTDSAMKQLELYVFDHRYNNVALPFYSLVTDRMNIPDTSKWVTRIYYPIL